MSGSELKMPRGPRPGTAVVLAIAAVAALSTAGCDECAGMEAQDRARCCVEHSESPSCATIPHEDECGAVDNDAPSRACSLGIGAPHEGRLDPAGAAHDVDFFSLVAPNGAGHASLIIDARLSSEGDASVSAAAIDVVVTNEDEEFVTSFVVPATTERTSHSFGVVPGRPYFVRLAPLVELDGGSLAYGIELAFGDDLFELEPNGDALRATAVAEGVTRGSSGARAVDLDFFSVIARSGATRMTVSLSVDEDAPATGRLEGAVLDTRQAIVAALTATADMPATAAVGVSEQGEYLIRVGGTSTDTAIGYVLQIEFDRAHAEIEPNDTVPNAQELVLGEEVVGSYSQTPPLVDDDIYCVVGVDTSAEVVVTLDRTSAATGELTLAILDDRESVLESIDVAPGEIASLTASAPGAEHLFVRVRLDETVQGESYELRVTQDR